MSGKKTELKEKPRIVFLSATVVSTSVEWLTSQKL